MPEAFFLETDRNMSAYYHTVANSPFEDFREGVPSYTSIKPRECLPSELLLSGSQ